jgi:hypothetical protein
VVIRTSTAREVQQLVAELRHGSPIARQAAIARLRVLGTRAVASLSALVRRERDATLRVAAMRALEGIDDPRGVDIALHALADADLDVRLSAVAALRGWVAQDEGARIMDALASVALDASQDRAVRAAARDALTQLPADIVRPILAHAGAQTTDVVVADDARSVHEWLASHEGAPLSSLHDLVARTRERESVEPEDSSRREWLAVRGAVHAALARRGSRVALYDLREAFDAAHAPLPPEFVTAAAAIGDATCLEPMARAWSRTTADGSWRQQLSDAASAIVDRLRLTARHQTVKRVKKVSPGFLPVTRR